MQRKRGNVICRVCVNTILAITAAVLLSGCAEQEKEKLTKEIKQKERIVQSNKVRLQTSMGEIVIELDTKKAPVSSKNFISYVEAKHYDGTIFHRVIPNFMIQGGGFTSDMKQKSTRSPIVNEAANGLKNDRGTLAMARTNNPDSATSQFFSTIKTMIF